MLKMLEKCHETFNFQEKKAKNPFFGDIETSLIAKLNLFIGGYLKST